MSHNWRLNASSPLTVSAKETSHESSHATHLNFRNEILAKSVASCRVCSTSGDHVRTCRFAEHRDQPGLRGRREYRRDIQKRFHRTLQSRHDFRKRRRLVGAVCRCHRHELDGDQFNRQHSGGWLLSSATSRRRKYARHRAPHTECHGQHRHGGRCRQGRSGEHHHRVDRRLPNGCHHRRFRWFWHHR